MARARAHGHGFTNGEGDIRPDRIGNPALGTFFLDQQGVKGCGDGKQGIQVDLAKQSDRGLGVQTRGQIIAGALILHGGVEGLRAGHIGEGQVYPYITVCNRRPDRIGNIGIAQRALKGQLRRDEQGHRRIKIAGRVLDGLNRLHIRSRVGSNQHGFA